MTITSLLSPISPNDLGASRSKTTSDRAEKSGSFLDDLKQVGGVEQVSVSAASDTGETSQEPGLPAITEQAIASLPLAPVGFQPATADQASSPNEEQPHLPNSQNLAGKADGVFVTPEADLETSTPDQTDNLENPDHTLSEHEDEDTARDTDQSVQDTAIAAPEILTTAMPVAITVQNIRALSGNDQESEAPERNEPAQTSPVTPTTFKAFSPIPRSTKADEEALSGSDSDPVDSENDSMTASDTESFSDILMKASDPGPAKQAVDEIRKLISLPNDSGQVATTSGRPTTLNDLPLEIGMRVLEGAREIQIVLSPESLGEISIKLDIASDSSISAQFTTDNPATLSLLMQDASTLKRSLDQTGFSTNSASLQFSLSRDGRQSGNQNEQNSNGHHQNSAYSEQPFANSSKDLPPTALRAYSLQRLDRII